MKFLTLREKLGRPECPYLERWVLNLYFVSFRIHHWISGDDDRCFHDHPWWFLTIILKGSYVDYSERGREYLSAGCVRWRPALHRHTVEVPEGGCWTFLITGRQIRRWGFWLKGYKFVKSNKYFLEHGHHPCK